jgi:hypothetical protein
VLMRNLVFMAVVCALIGSFTLAQDTNPGPATDTQALLKEFTRSMKSDGYTLSFVLLNDKTVEALFQAPGKYAMRARANQSTTFYVQGMPDKEIAVETKFSVEQGGQSIPASSLNIKNFDGTKVAKGTRVDGIIQVERKLDLARPFKITGPHGSVEFKLSEEALKVIQN